VTGRGTARAAAGYAMIVAVPWVFIVGVVGLIAGWWS
jgi:hypothetical protein